MCYWIRLIDDRGEDVIELVVMCHTLSRRIRNVIKLFATKRHEMKSYNWAHCLFLQNKGHQIFPNRRQKGTRLKDTRLFVHVAASARLINVKVLNAPLQTVMWTAASLSLKTQHSTVHVQHMKKIKTTSVQRRMFYDSFITSQLQHHPHHPLYPVSHTWSLLDRDRLFWWSASINLLKNCLHGLMSPSHGERHSMFSQKSERVEEKRISSSYLHQTKNKNSCEIMLV